MEDVWGILYLRELWLLLIYLVGNYFFRLFELYYKVHLAQWIGKNEHQEKRKEKLKKSIKS